MPGWESIGLFLLAALELQLSTLVLLFTLSGTIVNSIVALLASRAGDALHARLSRQLLTCWLPGGVFVAPGLRLAFSRS